MLKACPQARRKFGRQLTLHQRGSDPDYRPARLAKGSPRLARGSPRLAKARRRLAREVLQVSNPYLYV